MTLGFMPDAEKEFVAAAEWYEAREKGLGRRFRDDVAHVLTRITEDPFLWRERPDGYHRVNCPVFPYYVAYIIRESSIIVTAVAHGRRYPGYWKHRLKAQE